MTPTELRELMTAAGCADDTAGRERFAGIVGVDARSIGRWLNGGNILPKNVHLLRTLAERPAIRAKLAQAPAPLETPPPTPPPATSAQANERPASSAPLSPTQPPTDDAPPAAPLARRRWPYAAGAGTLATAAVALVVALRPATAPEPDADAATPPSLVAMDDVTPPELVEQEPAGGGAGLFLTNGKRAKASPIPDRALKGQVSAPCPEGVRAIKGSCWVGPIEDLRAPCPSGFYADGAKCFMPLIDASPKTSPSSDAGMGR